LRVRMVLTACGSTLETDVAQTRCSTACLDSLTAAAATATTRASPASKEVAVSHVKLLAQIMVNDVGEI
jgi:hypothetical protein